MSYKRCLLKCEFSSGFKGFQPFFPAVCDVWMLAHVHCTFCRATFNRRLLFGGSFSLKSILPRRQSSEGLLAYFVGTMVIDVNPFPLPSIHLALGRPTPRRPSELFLNSVAEALKVSQQRFLNQIDIPDIATFKMYEIYDNSTTYNK